MLIFHSHGKWYLPNMEEIDLATVIQWQEEGLELQVKEEERID